MSAARAPQHTRAPIRSHPRHALRRGGAGLLLLGVLTGPPALLLALLGDPLHVPSVLRDGVILTSPVTDSTLLWLLASLAWLMWLHLLGCLVVEVLRQTGGSSVRMPLPGLLFGANTLLASHLIATLLLSGQPIHRSGLTPFSGASPRASEVASPVSLNAATRTPTQQALTVAYPTRDSIPEPEADRAGAITERTASLIECRVLPPEGRHHDTLWDIAERHLGDGVRWREIFALNNGRLMPDGQRLTHASRIRPGWTLLLPADARVLAADQVAAPESHPRAETLVRPAPHAASPQAVRNDGRDLTDRDGPPPGAGAPTGQDTTPPPITESVLPSAPETTGSSTQHAVEDDGSQHAELALGLGTLSVAALAWLAALTRRRKVATRRRPVGVRAARPAPELLAAETRLRQQARAADIAATVRLALLIAAPQLSTARVKAVWEHPDGSIELMLSEHQADRVPAPFTATPRGWLLSRQQQRYLFAVRTDGLRRQDRDTRLAQQLDAAADPYPLLLPVGERNGSACLVNLEPLGLISVTRAATESTAHDPAADLNPAAPHDPAPGRNAAPQVTDLLTGWVPALSGAPWNEQAHLYLPPAWAELAVGLDHVHLADPTDSHAMPRPLPTKDRDSLTDHDSLEAARHAHAGMAEVIGMQVTLGYQLHELPEHLLRAALDPLDPNIVVLHEPHPDAHHWTLSADGLLVIPGICDALTPTTLDPDQHQLLLRLLEHAQDPPHAAPDDPHRTALETDCPALTPEQMDASEPPRPDRGLVALQPPPVAPADIPDHPRRDDPESDDARRETGAGTQVPPAPRLTPVEVGVLGPTVVGGADTEQPRLQALEMLVYLCLHRQPITLEALSEAIWPDRGYQDRTVQNRIGDLRRYLGDNHLVKVSGNRWRLTDLVTSDWQRFKTLAAGNPEQQRRALELVRGIPFTGAKRDWMHLDGTFAEIEASIVDLALELGQRALKTGHYELARDAAQHALRACPYDERLYRLGIESAAARDATAEIRQLTNQLNWVMDTEIEPDDSIQPATNDLLQRLRADQARVRHQQQRRS